MEKQRGIFSSRLRLIFVLLFVLLAFASSICMAEIELPMGKLEVRSKTEYRVQWSRPPDKFMVPNDSSDQDFEEQLGITWDMPEKGITFNFLGRYRKDLDGTPVGSIFQDYIDACGKDRQQLMLYYGYLEFNNIIPNYSFRLGRQYVFGVDQNIQLDGAWIRGDRPFNIDWLSFEIYGGMPSQPFANLNKDGIVGLNLEFYPIKNLVLHADTTFYKENAWTVYADWRPYENLRVDAHGAFINEHARYAFLNIVGDIEKTGTTIGFKYYRNFENEYDSEFIFDWQSPEDDLGNDIRRLYLAREMAYNQFDISLSQAIPTQEGLAFFTRLSIRKLASSDDEDLYNTDFISWTAGITINEWLHLEGFHCSLGITKWWENREHIYEANSISFFADVRQELFDRWEILGGYYFKTEDVNSLIENEAANHYYGAIRYRIDHEKWAEIKYEYERDDYYKEYGISDINSLTATVYVKF